MTPAKGPESSWIEAKRLVPELPPDPTPVSHGLQLSLGRRHRCGHGSFLWQRTIPRQRRNSWRGNWLQFVSAANTPSCRQNKTHKTGASGGGVWAACHSRQQTSDPVFATSKWPWTSHSAFLSFHSLSGCKGSRRNKFWYTLYSNFLRTILIFCFVVGFFFFQICCFCFVLFYFLFLFIFFIFLLFRAILAAYESSQARGWIRAAAAGLHPTIAKPDSQPMSETRGQTCVLMDTSGVLNLLSHSRNSNKFAVF